MLRPHSLPEGSGTVPCLSSRFTLHISKKCLTRHIGVDIMIECVWRFLSMNLNLTEVILED
jgi:hypothetical protein